MLIKRNICNMLDGFKLITGKKKDVIDYVYERIEEEIVQTYEVTKTEEDIVYLSPLQHFYFSILGEKTIEKLEGKGYLSIEEFNEKYSGNTIEKIPQKTKRR